MLETGYYEDSSGVAVPNRSKGAIAHDSMTESGRKLRHAIGREVDNWNRRTGAQVKVVDRVEDIPNIDAKTAIMNGTRVAGYFDGETGEVYIYAPNIDSADHLIETLVHENVAHKGLRGLLGKERFEALLDRVWEMMPQRDKDYFLRYPGVNGNTRAAADEYIAHIAEGSNVITHRAIWCQIVSYVKEFLRAIGFKKLKMTHRELDGLLRRAYRNLNNVSEADVVFDVSPAAEIHENAEKQASTKARFNTVQYYREGRGKLRKALDTSVKNEVITKEIAEEAWSVIETAYAICKAKENDFDFFAEWGMAEIKTRQDGVNADGTPKMVPVFSVIKKNGDYVMNLDFSLLCKKRETLDAVLQVLADKGVLDERGLSGIDIAKINDIIREAGFETACSISFVDARRYRVEELRLVYQNLECAEKDGRKIEFFNSAFKKIYKEGGLFAQVIPHLKEILESSILAYSGPDSYGGQVRPDGTTHREHPSVEEFANYVGKIKIDDRVYYIRSTVQCQTGQIGTHSFFVTDVDVYEQPADGLSYLNFPSGESDHKRIVDAKLQHFFERAKKSSGKVLFSVRTRPRAAKPTARDRYEQTMRSSSFQMKEAMVDSLQGLQEAMMAIRDANGGKEKYIEDINDSMNPYIHAINLSSVNHEQAEIYKRKRMKPIAEAFNAIITDEYSRSKDEINRYIMAKHGLERNALMRQRAVGARGLTISSVL